MRTKWKRRANRLLSVLMAFAMILTTVGAYPLITQAEEGTPSAQNRSADLEGIGEELYSSDFSSYEEWQTYTGLEPAEWIQGENSWTIQGSRGNKAVLKDHVFTDFVYEADVTVEKQSPVGSDASSAQAGLIFRVSNPENGGDAYEGYYVCIDAHNRWVSLGKVTDGKWSEIAKKKTSIEYGVTYHVTVAVSGNHIVVYVNYDGEQYAKIDVTDSDHASGTIGLRNWLSDATYRNVKVSAYAEPQAEGATYQNPILPNCADPDILYDNGTYYLYPTNAGDSSQGIKVYTSTDLVNWTDKGWALNKNDVWGDTGFWAPDLIERDGVYYMYYTANEHICVATSDSPLGPFTQEVQKPLHEDVNEIDAHVFQDDDGQYYLYFVRFDNGNVLHGAKLNDDMMSIDESTVTRLFEPDGDWEQDMGRINEGPFMLKKDGVYYLTYSGSHFESPNYGSGYATSTDPLKGFVKYENNPIMQSNSLVKGAGHHCITTSPDGKEMFMVYHCHNNTTTTEPRRLCIDRIQFTEVNGETVLEVKGPTVTPQSIPSGASDVDNLICVGEPDVSKIQVVAGSTPDTWNLPDEIHSVVTSKSDPNQPYSAEVVWDTSEYDAQDTTERELTITGTVILPENVVNLGNLDLEVELTVSVQKDVQTGDLSGLYAQYYTIAGSGTNVTLNTLKSEGVDYDINFSDLETKLAATTGQSDAAGIRWTGQIEVPKTGNYTFYGYSDNGLRLWIDGEQLINYWDGGLWDALQTSKSVTLEAGRKYNFRADYFDYEGGSHVILYWSNDQGMERKVIPASAYFMPENYQGMYISNIDTSQGNLTEGEAFDGTIAITGRNLSDAEAFEVVKATGDSLSEPTYAQINSVSATSANLTLTPLPVGTYKLKAIQGNQRVLSEQNLIVKPDMEAEPDRSETPRRDWERDSYVNLNGWWSFAFDPSEVGIDEGWYAKDQSFEQNINVPFCWESSLSGIQDENYKGQAWYQRTVTVDESWEGKKIFLKFGAVDWKCKLWVNGEEVGEHIGGYSAFEMDVTDYMIPGEENVITLWVEDKGNYGDDSYPALVGKQGRNAPCGYTHTSGIWQTVGMEARSNTYLDQAKAASDIDQSQVTYTVDVTSDADQELTLEYDFESTLYDVATEQDVKTGSTVKGSQTFAVKAGENTITLDPIQIENQKLWDYREPNLYQGTLTLKDGEGNVVDQLSTYFGLRKIETKYYDEDLGVKYIYLNNEPIYLSGLLDQGFWEEGIYTAPSEDALRYDILAMKEAGFNMIRKHLKIEDPLQYYWCDKLGMMVWQDMPHATAMVPATEGGSALGRQYYEECLDTAMNMNYNHPSIVAVMLFNETWGLQSAYSSDEARNRKADDGMSTAEWVEHLYQKTKETNPNILVEDMSPCNKDHVQPTDLNTYHMYPSTYASTLSTVEEFVNGAYEGSSHNFKFGETQDGDPLLNSEYGGVAAYAGDYDVSYCFKYMTDIQRRYEKQSGFVYTEPYDVEYERNGILTYDRQWKIFGYDEIAYGGDMGIKDLTQETYIGIVDQPIKNVKPNQRIKTKIMAMSWTNDVPENSVVKWRFDGTDVYGNSISTGLSGTLGMKILPYEKAEATISFRAPAQSCVGTLTVWIESAEGEKIAKNFMNIVVADESAQNQEASWNTQGGALVMRAAVNDGKMMTTEGAGEQSYTYTLPEDFDLEDLNGMRVLAEASSYKGQMGTDKNKSSFSSQWGQTAVGRELATDMTVLINGVEIDTVYLPDDPRDMRGTLSLNQPNNGATSAGDFGYLVNLNIDAEKLAAIKEAMGEDHTITVTYQVKEDAENPNGLRIYNSVYGRYAVNPTIILNPDEIASQEIVTQEQAIETGADNYSAEAVLESKAGFVLRTDNEGGYRVMLEDAGQKVILTNEKTGEVLGQVDGLTEGAHHVKVTLFDDQIRVYVDRDPEAKINIYDYSQFTGGMICVATEEASMSQLAVSPESYEAPEGEIVDMTKDVLITDNFDDPNYQDRYQVMGNNWSGTVTDGALHMSADQGDKMILKDLAMADGVYEADITVTNSNGQYGNVGFVFRSSNYNIGADGADGYYAGIGDGYVQLGRTNQNWKELAKVSVPELKVGTTHRLRVAVFGSRIQVYTDDNETPCIDLTDSTYLEGGAAIRGYRATAIVDNIKIASQPRYVTEFANGIDEWDANGIWTLSDEGYTSEDEGAYALIDSEKIKNVCYETTLKLTGEDSAAALLLRAQAGRDGLDGYQVVVDAQNDCVKIVKTQQGQDTVLAQADRVFMEGDEIQVAAQCVGDTIQVYLDGKDKLILEAKDTSIVSGQIGIRNMQGATTVKQVKLHTEFIEEENFQFEELQKMILFAEGLNQEEYTAESWASLQEALQAAKAVKEDAAKTEIDEALTKLIAAVGGLEYGVQKQHLQAAVDAAEDILAKEQDYDESSLAVLKHVLEEAKEMLTDTTATQDAVNLMVSNLIDAIVQVAPDPDLASLGSLIDAVETLNGDKYTSESWGVLEQAVADAKEVLADSDRAEGALANAYLKLSQAIKGLVLKGNKAALAAVIEKAEEILANANAYVTATVEGLEEILEQARVVYEDEDAVQEEVNEAVETLTQKITQARLIGDVNGDGEINTGDTTAVLRASAEIVVLSEYEAGSADVNGDGQVNTDDAALILQYAAERIAEF